MTCQISKATQAKTLCVLKMVVESAWSCDDDVWPFGESDGLGHHIHSSDQDGAANPDRRSECGELLGYLTVQSQR
jgi:hypothetical protein